MSTSLCQAFKYRALIYKHLNPPAFAASSLSDDQGELRLHCIKTTTEI